ncbi:MAG: prephenate dehydratase [bacterium]
MKRNMPRVYFQGTRGAYSEVAAQILFGKDIESIGVARFEDTVDQLENCLDNYAILPIENSLMGSIHRNYDLLLASEVWIVAEVEMRITYNLFGLSSEEDIREIWAHPAALEQCRDFLAEHIDRKIVSFFDSAGAAEVVVRECRKDVGIIAGPQAGSVYGLNTLKEQIEDNSMNFTRFLVLSRKRQFFTGPEIKSSLVFGVKNEPGVLFRCLSIFALRNIDLLKLESRPIIGKPWEYIFYIDFKGSVEEENCKNAIETLESVAIYFKFLGSYPVVRGYK